MPVSGPACQHDGVRLDELPPPAALPAPLKALLARLDTDAGIRRLWWVIAAVVLVAVAVFIGRGGGRPKDPSFSGGATGGGALTILRSARLPGFGEAGLHVAAASGVVDSCAAVAATDATRSQGLMGRSDLAGYDAMVFTFPSTTAVPFYMRNTPVPLSIAWYGEDGAFLGSTDMAPCEDRADCRTYPAPRPYRLAVEVPQGGLARLGLTKGSVAFIGGPCP
jgi:uncharacterized membrane protein (UPF0127 family)